MSWLITIDGDAVNLNTESLVIEPVGDDGWRIVAKPSSIVVAIDLTHEEARALVEGVCREAEMVDPLTAKYVMERINE